MLPKRYGDAVWRELRIPRENLLLRRAAGNKLKEELDTQTGATNRRLAVKNRRIGYDQIINHAAARSLILARRGQTRERFVCLAIARNSRVVMKRQGSSA